MTTSRPLYRPIACALAWLALFAGAPACGTTHEARSGETHFLRACPEQGCGGGLECLAGSCTRSCESDVVCEAIAEHASCEATAGASDGGASDGGAAQRACDVTCERDADCSALGSGFGCAQGRCRAAAAAGAPGPQGDAGAGPNTSPVCVPGCSGVWGYPEDPERGCAVRGEPVFVGCDCNLPAAFGRCVRRSRDGALFAVRASDDALTSGLERCALGEADRVATACEFAQCAHRPLTTCTLEATCADRGCDNLEFFADGCRRQQCTRDDQCEDDERCVSLGCLDASACTVSRPGPLETCGCAGGLACIAGSVCNPTSAVGPRGAWSKLVFYEGGLDCPDTSGCKCCATQLELDPAGTLIRRTGTEETVASATPVSVTEVGLDEMLDVNRIVNGPSLRVRLRDGFACADMNDPVRARQRVIRLELPDQRMEQAIGLCDDDSELRELRAKLNAL